MATILYFRGDGVRFDYTVTEEPWEFVPHTHQVWELIFLKTGNISYMVNGKVYHPGENSLIISRPENIILSAFKTTSPMQDTIFRYHQICSLTT